MKFLQKTIDLIRQAETALMASFAEIDDIAFQNQLKVLDAFRENNVAPRHFAGSTGYGYDDIGRDTLCKVFANIFGTESALVSPLIASGTHAISASLFGLLRPNQRLLCISGNPYDTLQEVISGENIGSLKDFGVIYDKIDLIDGKINLEKTKQFLLDNKTTVVFIGRSRGYEWRDALSILDLEEAISLIKAIDKDIVIFVDNCYGEFVDILEPTNVGADVIAGSLIKNAGGGIAPSGGYICGKNELIKQISYRLIAPSVGFEVGSYAYGYLPYYQGVFIAPHTTAGAIKGSLLMNYVFSDLGYKTLPEKLKKGGDIISSIEFNTRDELIDFIRAIQQASPVDSNVVPYPWDMPGYSSQVIMAAGTFIQGASIELSADSPIKKPYIAYFQGGITYEHIKIAVLFCADKIVSTKLNND